MPTSTITGTSATNITGYKAFASARLGSNGDPSSTDWEYFTGGAGGSAVSAGRMAWDQNPVNTIEGGPIDTELDALAGGGANGVVWTVPGGVTVPLLTSAASYGAINSVKIRAFVADEGCLFSWSSITVNFYKNGSLVETVNCPDVVADTTDSPDSPLAEQIATITPSNNDNTKVVILATLHLLYGSDEIDSPDSVSGQIYVFAA